MRKFEFWVSYRIARLKYAIEGAPDRATAEKLAEKLGTRSHPAHIHAVR